MPATHDEWKKIATDFYIQWNFPNCCGALDGKHIAIKPPHNSGSYYFNYKGSHSIVLMALADAHCRFIYADIGTNGRVSDAGVWQNSFLRRGLETGTLQLPPPCAPPASQRILPHVIIADDAFPLTENLLKPFSHRSMSAEENVFSYRLSRARRTVESAFGILANRFRVFLAPIGLSPSITEKVVLGSLVLHNFLITENRVQYTEGAHRFEHENQQQGSLIQLQRLPRPTASAAKRVREDFKAYFNEEGAVQWQ